MNQGVEILLARMDSNPDEFVGDVYASSNKWDWFLTQLGYRVNPTPEIKKEGYVALGYLSDAEIKALWEKLESLRADQFTKKVMSTLLQEEHESDEEFMRYNTKGRGGAVSRAQMIADLLPAIEQEFRVCHDEANKKRGKK